MPLNPAHKAELEQRKTDIIRRIAALKQVHDNITVPDEDPPAGLVSGLAAIWADLQTATTAAQNITVPDEDPPAGIVQTLQTAETGLHGIETRLLDPAASAT